MTLNDLTLPNEKGGVKANTDFGWFMRLTQICGPIAHFEGAEGAYAGSD